MISNMWIWSCTILGLCPKWLIRIKIGYASANMLDGYLDEFIISQIDMSTIFLFLAWVSLFSPF